MIQQLRIIHTLILVMLKSYPHKRKGKFWLEPVKGKMHSPHAPPTLLLPLTEPNQN